MIFYSIGGPGSSGVEQWTENPRVGGSNPPPGTIFIKTFFLTSIFPTSWCRFESQALPQMRLLEIERDS